MSKRAETLAKQLLDELGWHEATALKYQHKLQTVTALLEPHLVGEWQPHKKINFVTAIEHQIYRNHPYSETCPECRLAIQIANKLRDELSPPKGEQSHD